ncbi:MAG TPA: hypothetical protein VIT91_08535 [Chthoniobacterales bacterium]
MKPFLLPLVSLVGLAAATFAADKSSVFREPGATYLEDILDKPLRLKVPEDTTIYYDARLERGLGILAGGQFVEIQAILDDKVRVIGKARQGQVSGWLPAADLEKMNPDFVADLKKAGLRKAQVDAMIEKNEVAVGMTTDEVLESLGKPPKKSQRQDAQGVQELWEYVRYKRVPQQTVGYDDRGNYVTQIIYVKIPAGKLAITFEDGLVAAVDQTEGSLHGRASIVVPPPLEVESY